MLKFLQSYQKRSPGKNENRSPGSKPPSSSFRRKRKEKNKAPNATLKYILGLTTCQNSAFAVHPSQDIIAYPAGCVVVLYNYKKNKQFGFLQAVDVAAQQSSTSTESNKPVFGSHATPNSTGGTFQSKKLPNNIPKTISSLAFSSDGKYLAVGECGYRPRVLIWDWKLSVIVGELFGHKFGVATVSFSPNMRYLVSIGFQHDGFLYAWDWRAGVKVASNKISSKVYALTFAKNGSYCITAGLRHIKYWYFDLQESSSTSTMKVMIGRSGILSNFSNNVYVDVACGKDEDGSEIMYCITNSGLLCQFSKERVVQKWINLQVKEAYSLCVDDSYIACGCENGIIRLFEPITLRYLGTLPRPHQLNVDVTSPDYQPNTNQVYPNTIAIRLTYNSEKLACVYSDHSMFVWDIKNLEHLGKYRSFLFHSDCVWNVETYPERFGDSLSPGACIPSSSFATCSSDGTVRFWNLEHLYSSSSAIPAISSQNPSVIESHRGNIYSRELQYILFIDKCPRVSADSTTPGGALTSSVRMANSTVIRSIRISPNGQFLASGDKEGNLRVYDLLSMEQVAYQEAHNGDILAIDFSDPSITGPTFMVATAGRDRLIHIFDANNSFTPIQTLDDHSAAITSLKFSNGGQILVSCSADKSIIFRKATGPVKIPYFVSYQNHCAKASVYDMDLDTTKPIVASVTQDKRFHIFGIDSGKLKRSHRPESLDENSLDTNILKISLDPSGSFVATCCSDKSIRIFDIHNGNLIAKLYGHSEQVTSVKFSQDCTKLISTAGDGCVFIWSLSPAVTKQMLKSQRMLFDAEGNYSSIRSKNELKDTIVPSSSGEVITINSIDDLELSQHVSKTENLTKLFAAQSTGKLSRRAVSESRGNNGSRGTDNEGAPKSSRKLSFPGFIYNSGSSTVTSPVQSLLKPPKFTSHSSTDDDDLTSADSSENEGFDEIIYLDSAESKGPISVVHEFTIEENKPCSINPNFAVGETSDENALSEAECNDPEEDEIFDNSEEFLAEFLETANAKNDCQRQSMSAKFLSSSVTPGDDLENIPEDLTTETNVAEARNKLSDSLNLAYATSLSQAKPTRHRRRRSSSLNFPIDTSDTFQIMTPPRSNKTPQELEHSRRALRNAGLLTLNQSKKNSTARNLSPILPPRIRQRTPRKYSVPSLGSTRQHKEAPDIVEGFESMRPLEALNKILQLQCSLSKALESQQHLFQALPQNSPENGLFKQVYCGLIKLQTQIESIQMQEIDSTISPTASSTLNVVVEHESVYPGKCFTTKPRIGIDETDSRKFGSNAIDNTQKPRNMESAPSKTEYSGLTNMLEKYSDLLLKMVDQKMNHPQGPSCSEPAAPTSTSQELT